MPRSYVLQAATASGTLRAMAWGSRLLRLREPAQAIIQQPVRHLLRGNSGGSQSIHHRGRRHNSSIETGLRRRAVAEGRLRWTGTVLTVPGTTSSSAPA
jgi:hypothetical protein